MDQENASEALNPTPLSGVKKLNAGAPEFVPLSSSSSAVAPSPPAPMMPPLYARPPHFARPLVPTYYGYDGYYPQKVMPFYGYNVSPVGPREFSADGNNGSAASPRNGLTDAHQKVINQVEFYFSDINLATTDQLFRYMSKDPEGYVPISVVASFKKIKNAISDTSQLASVLRSSQKLVVSEDGKKVKRQQPLTESDMEELQARIIVAENLPEDHSHQNLLKIFSSVGSVKSIRTCPPQNWNGASSASKTSKGDGLNLSGKLHTFVEYESAEAAEKAVIELNDDGTWRNGLKVRLLLKTAVKPSHTRLKKVVVEGRNLSKKDEAVASETLWSKENQSDGILQHYDESSNDLKFEDSPKNNAPKTCGSKVKEKGQSRCRRQLSVNGGGSISGCPPTQSPPIPRMPDGTKGFSMGRGKPLATESS